MWTLEPTGEVSIITPPGLSRRANSSSARVGFGHVLQHFAAEDCVEAGIWCGYSGDVADQIDTGGIPAIGLQTFIRRARPAFVLAKVLRHIVQMNTMIAVFGFPGTIIKQACALGQVSQGLVKPTLAVY